MSEDKEILTINQNGTVIDEKIDKLNAVENKKGIDKNVEEDNEDEELEWLIKQKEQIKKEEERIHLEEEQLQIELEQHNEDVKNNLAIFLHWIKINYSSKELYKNFCDDFSEQYRTELFENICEFFRDETFVSDEILFYWKCIVAHLLKNSKKYRSYIGDLIFDYEKQTTNLKVVREKYIFKCFIDDEQICYFKENGTDYYVS
jgi:hypothetical protein